MAQLAEVQEFIEQARKARTLPALAAMMEAITKDIGFDHYALVQHVDVRRSSSAATIWLENYPQSWAEAFVAAGLYSSDPIHIASQRTSVGFLWSEAGQFIRLTAHHKRVLEQARGEGLEDGFTIPAHLPGESNGSCSFGVRRGRSVPRANLMAAQLIGAFAFEAARKIVARKQRTDESKPKLTTRQIDCLTLVARGKTDWEIGRILGISQGTAKDYIKEACTQYDVRRRIQLVLRAVHDGQLTLGDAIG